MILKYMTMNENIDLIKILKNCPGGTKLYSLVHGEVEFDHIETCCRRQYVIIELKDFILERINFNGKLYNSYDGECILFPSKDQRDWSKFIAPWYKKEADTIDSIEKQGEQASSQINERAWLYLVSDVLTWKDGIGQYLDDQRVQEFAKKLCSEYAQKLYNPSVLSNPSNTGKNKQKFDPKTLKSFDRVLVRDEGKYWDCDLFSYISNRNIHHPYATITSFYDFCIPYNDDTKHLVGTTDEVPEYYRYWED